MKVSMNFFRTVYVVVSVFRSNSDTRKSLISKEFCWKRSHDGEYLNRIEACRERLDLRIGTAAAGWLLRFFGSVTDSVSVSASLPLLSPVVRGVVAVRRRSRCRTASQDTSAAGRPGRRVRTAHASWTADGSLELYDGQTNRK